MAAAVEKVLAWHFLSDDGRMQFGQREKIEAGKTYIADGRQLVLCSWGLHASEWAIDALSYAPGSLVCRVELGGEILRDTDKLCARERRVLWMADATIALHEFSAWAAEWILDKLEAEGDFKADPRSHAAIAAKRAWLKGEISDQQLAAAWAAAWAVARAVAGAAAGADAGDDAGDAAWAAARAAAGAARADAGDAAWAAARAAAGAALNNKLTEMLLALEPAPVAI
jgi:hypothetical protein